MTDEEVLKMLGPLPTSIGEPCIWIEPVGLLTRSAIVGIIAERDAARAELAAVTAERDRLREALGEINLNVVARIRLIASQALAAGLPPTPGDVRDEE